MRFIAVLGYLNGSVDYVGPFESLTECTDYAIWRSQVTASRKGMTAVHRWHVAQLKSPEGSDAQP